MAGNFSNIMDSKYSLVARLSIICCLIIIAGTSAGEHCGLHFVSFAAILIDAAIFLAWLIWVIIVNLKKIPVRPMNPEPRNFINIVSFMLFVYWILTGFFDAICGPWIVIPTIVIYIATIIITFTMKARR